MGSPEGIEAERLKRQSSQTAAERYAEHRSDVTALLDLLRQEITEHCKKAALQPNEWGFAGDFGYVRRSLKEVLQFLIAPRFESNSDASKFIESQLVAKRSSL